MRGALTLLSEDLRIRAVTVGQVGPTVSAKEPLFSRKRTTDTSAWVSADEARDTQQGAHQEARALGCARAKKASTAAWQTRRVKGPGSAANRLTCKRHPDRWLRQSAKTDGLATMSGQPSAPKRTAQLELNAANLAQQRQQPFEARMPRIRGKAGAKDLLPLGREGPCVRRSGWPAMTRRFAQTDPLPSSRSMYRT